MTTWQLIDGGESIVLRVTHIFPPGAKAAVLMRAEACVVWRRMWLVVVSPLLSRQPRTLVLSWPDNSLTRA